MVNHCWFASSTRPALWEWQLMMMFMVPLTDWLPKRMNWQQLTTRFGSKHVASAYSRHGLLFDPLVRPIFKPVSSFTHDWMHCILSNGVFATCMFYWLEAIEPHMQIYKVLSDYLPLWHHPKHQACKLELLFSDKKRKNNKDSSTFKCSASEALSLLPVLSYFIQSVLWPADVCKKESKVTWQD